MSRISLPLDTAAQYVAVGVKDEVKRAINKAVREAVEPIIQEVVEQQVESFIKEAHVSMYRDASQFDKLNVAVEFVRGE